MQQASTYISDLETKIATMNADNERLNKMLDERSRENEALRIKLAGIEGNLMMLNNLQSQISYLQNDNKSRVSQGHYTSEDITSNKKKSSELE